MKVRYSVDEKLTYAGTLEMTEEEYKRMDKMGDKELGELILERVDKSDPSDSSLESVDEFQKVNLSLWAGYVKIDLKPCFDAKRYRKTIKNLTRRG